MPKKLLLSLIIGVLYITISPLYAQDSDNETSSGAQAFSDMIEKTKDFFSEVFSSKNDELHSDTPVSEIDVNHQKDVSNDANKASKSKSVAEVENKPPVIPQSLGLSVESDVEVTDVDRKAANAEITAREVGEIKDDVDNDPVSEDDPIAVLKQKAMQGDIVAQYYLGKAYASGKGIKKDLKQAAAWYRKAADNGNVDAQNNLGTAYWYGHGVLKDQEEAMSWWRLASNEGNAAAQTNLGMAYATGQGINKNMTKAINLWRKAAEQDNAQAQYYLGISYGKDDPRSYPWFRKAADQGVIKAQTAVGLAYENGIGVAKDEEEAVLWYRKAADQQDVEAQLRLGDCYYYGVGVGKNMSKANQFYQKAVDQGNAEAQYNLGVSYWFGSGIAKNYVKAINLWKLAAQQGHSGAILNLGIAYQEGGKGVNKNDAYAYVLFNEASSKSEEAATKLQELESAMSVDEINQAQSVDLEEIIGKKKNSEKKEAIDQKNSLEHGGIQQRSRK